MNNRSSGSLSASITYDAYIRTEPIASRVPKQVPHKPGLCFLSSAPVNYPYSMVYVDAVCNLAPNNRIQRGSFAKISFQADFLLTKQTIRDK